MHPFDSLTMYCVLVWMWFLLRLTAYLYTSCHFEALIMHNSLYSLLHTSHRTTGIQRDPRPPIPPCVMVSSAWGSSWGLRVFADHTGKNKRKTNASTISAHHAAFHVCLSAPSDRSRCRWHTNLMNQLFWAQEKPEYAHAGSKMVQILESQV